MVSLTPSVSQKERVESDFVLAFQPYVEFFEIIVGLGAVVGDAVDKLFLWWFEAALLCEFREVAGFHYAVGYQFFSGRAIDIRPVGTALRPLDARLLFYLLDDIMAALE